MKSLWIMVDIESDGPCSGLYSMIEFGAVVCNDTSKTFHGKLQPISENYVQEALNVTGYTREQTLAFNDPEHVMKKFNEWLISLNAKPMFISDNNGFDWQFINYYFWKYLNGNPFGFSSTNLGSLYKGVVKDMFKNFKHLRETKHDHNPVNDAIGNVEAFNKVLKLMK